MKRTITALFLSLAAFVCFPLIVSAQDDSLSGGVLTLDSFGVIRGGSLMAENRTISLADGSITNSVSGLFLQTLTFSSSALLIMNNTALDFVTRDSSYHEGGVYLQLSAGSVHVLELTVPVSVPEPATWLLVFLSAGMLLGFHRLQRW